MLLYRREKDSLSKEDLNNTKHQKDGKYIKALNG